MIHSRNGCRSYPVSFKILLFEKLTRAIRDPKVLKPKLGWFNFEVSNPRKVTNISGRPIVDYDEALNAVLKMEGIQ